MCNHRDPNTYPRDLVGRTKDKDSQGWSPYKVRGIRLAISKIQQRKKLKEM